MRSYLVASLRIEHEAAIAVWAIDEVLISDLQIDLRMTERTATSVAGDASVVHDDGFWRFAGHIASR
jgi:hypothetical protein